MVGESGRPLKNVGWAMPAIERITFAMRCLGAASSALNAKSSPCQPKLWESYGIAGANESVFRHHDAPFACGVAEDAAVPVACCDAGPDPPS